jgi:GTP-binding protein
LSDFEIFSAETKHGKDNVWDWLEARMLDGSDFDPADFE